MSKETQKEVEDSIKTDYRSGSFLPKDYKTEEEKSLEIAKIKEMKQRNELDWLAEQEEQRKSQEIIDNYNKNNV